MLEIQQLARGCCSRHVNFTLRRRYICKEYVESLPRDGLTRIWQEEGPRAIIGSSIVFWILELGHNMAGSSVVHRTKQGTSDRGTVLGYAAGCSGHNTSTEGSGLLDKVSRRWLLRRSLSDFKSDFKTPRFSAPWCFQVRIRRFLISKYSR